MNNKEFVKITRIMIDLIRHEISLPGAIREVEDMQDE